MSESSTNRTALGADLLAGRTVWITGGGTGLGRAMALRAADLGAAVALCGRREEPLRETAAAITDSGGRAACAPGCDVRDPDAVERAVVALEEELGPIDTLVNNAAGNFLAPSESLSPNAFGAVVGIVLHGTWHCTQAAAKRWIERGNGGTVLNIVTTYAWTGSAFVVPSACAKAGVLAMTRSLTAEWARYGIRLNAIAPGPIPTEGAFRRLMPDPKLAERRARHIPAGRFGTPEELAELASFLVSDAADWIRGEVVTLDGGEWVRNAGEFNFLLDENVPWEALRGGGSK